jgi:hypothetical protein
VARFQGDETSDLPSFAAFLRKESARLGKLLKDSGVASTQ